jgi:WD40 repeat protein
VAIGAPLAAYRINQARVELRRRSYAAEMNVAFQALAENNPEGAVQLLEGQRAERGEEDLRGFEWRYLWSQCQDRAKASFADVAGRCLAYSADGQLLAYVGGEGKGWDSAEVIVRNAGSHALVKVLQTGAESLSFSPRTNLLATADKSGVRLWDTDSWQEVGPKLAGAMFPARFSPDGQWLVTRGAGQFQLWHTETWQLRAACPSALFADWTLTGRLAFSPDGRFLVTPDDEKATQRWWFKLWTMPDLNEVPGFNGDSDVDSAAFTADGRYLLTGGDAGALLVWDIEKRSVVEQLPGHTGSIWGIAVSPDGRFFATASAERIVQLWEAGTRNRVTTLRGHFHEVFDLAFSPDSRTLASIDTSNPGVVKLWDVHVRDRLERFDDASVVAGFSGDSGSLFLATTNRVKRWSLDRNTVEDTGLLIRDPYPQLHHGNWLSVGSRGADSLVALGQTNGMVEIREIRGATRVASWQAGSNAVESVAFTPNATLLATGSTGGEVSAWDAATSREIVRLEPFKGPIACVTFSPDAKTLAVSVFGKQVALFDLAQRRAAATLEGRHSAGMSMAFSPDGKLLLAALTDNTAALWDLPSGNRRATLKGHFQLVMDVGFSPDGKTLATGSDDRKIKLWHLATLQELVTLSLEVPCRTLAGGLQLGSIRETRLWRAPSLAEIEAVVSSGAGTRVSHNTEAAEAAR